MESYTKYYPAKYWKKHYTQSSLCIVWKKKPDLIQKCNGKELVKIHTLRGSFSFSNQKYILKDGNSSSFLALHSSLGAKHYSPDLCNFIEQWSDDLSYSKMAVLLSQVTGNEVLSASGIQSYLESKAVSISEQWLSENHISVKEIAVKSDIAVLDATSPEIVIMVDDVGVKAQKPHKLLERAETDAKRLDTTVILVQDAQKNYHYATSGIDKEGKTNYTVEQALIDKVVNLHGTDAPLPIVAITDGARSIRLTLQAVFGSYVCIILDWYHLQHKIRNLMSMIAPNKLLKECYITDLKTLLWKGEAGEAIIYLDNIESVKNKEKLNELRGYIEKHTHEIINYAQRQMNAKSIGSGRCEKANDLIVAHRQKKKGMAWSRKGSTSLAIIKTFRLNNAIAA